MSGYQKKRLIVQPFFYFMGVAVVGWVSNPPNKPQGLCVNTFRLPENR
ncbi:MAG: hypothetical protein IKZ88_07185 [Neisseriaceae bacterium]|nr:hypothetical protein [Neisseriaceae bacterium]